jgi:ribose transport system substrate-binding protein
LPGQPAIRSGPRSNADAIVPALARAQAAGIPTANVNARLGPEGEEYVTFEIVADNAALGRSAAENLVEGMEKAGYEEGRVIVVTGTMGTLIVEDRMVEFDKYMAEHPQYEVVAPQDGNWDPVESGRKAQQLLTKYRSQGGVQGAYGMADYMAAGIIQAANQLGIKSGTKNGDLVVTASNCTPTGIPLMEKGVLWGNATQSPIEESEKAAERIVEFLEGNEVPHNTTVEEERFTAENYEEFVPLCAEWPS